MAGMALASFVGGLYAGKFIAIEMIGVVQVAFASGDVITLSARTMVGRIERPRPRATPRHAPAA